MKPITSSGNDKLQKLFCTYAIHCRTVTYKKVFRNFKRATSSIVHVDLAPIGQQGAVLAVTSSISPFFSLLSSTDHDVTQVVQKKRGIGISVMLKLEVLFLLYVQDLIG